MKQNINAEKTIKNHNEKMKDEPYKSLMPNLEIPNTTIHKNELDDEEIIFLDEDL